jgi:hypothetical protein
VAGFVVFQTRKNGQKVVFPTERISLAAMQGFFVA